MGNVADDTTFDEGDHLALPDVSIRSGQPAGAVDEEGDALEECVDFDAEDLDLPHIPMNSGLFPVGTNLTWHGGIHMAGVAGQPVQAMADGVVVAARLPQDDPEKPEFGSRNFVLIKHRTPKGDVFWSLHMHLQPLLLKDNDAAQLRCSPWLYDLQLEVTGAGGANLRPHPDTVSESDSPREASAGEIFAVLEERRKSDYLWYFVESQRDHARGWIAKTERVTVTAKVHGLEDLKAGKVVRFAHPIQVGTCVGFLSSPDPKTRPFVHWEVFSETLASGGWKAICDDDGDDVVCDAEALKKLINSNLPEAAFVGAMAKNLVISAYGDRQMVKRLASYAYRFESGWRVDWSRALKRVNPALAAVYGPRFNKYRFWQEAEAAGCDLPKGGKVYHYHPVAFKLVMFDNVKKAAASKVGKGNDPIWTNWPELANQNRYNSIILEAAKKYSIRPILLKSLIAQESAFNPKAHNNHGYAGLTQIGGAAIKEAGLHIGTTCKKSGTYRYDMASDERFIPLKSIFGGALIFSRKRSAINRLIFSQYSEPLEEDEKEKFYLAAYNAGEGTIRKAYMYCKQGNPTWDMLSDGKQKSYLWQAIPESWGKRDKHKEITMYVHTIKTRSGV